MATFKEALTTSLTNFAKSIAKTYPKTANIVDNLLSTDSTLPLSAKQGNVLQTEIDTLNSNLSTSDGKLKIYSGVLYLNGGATGTIYHHETADGAEWYSTPICLVESADENSAYDVSVVAASKKMHMIKNNLSITLGIRWMVIGIKIS